MKKSIVLALIVFIAGAKLYAQETNDETSPSQLFVIKADRKQFITTSNSLATVHSETLPEGMIYLNATWISDVNMLWGKEAIDKYGPQAENGVVLVTLNKGSLKLMPKEDRKRFKNRTGKNR